MLKKITQMFLVILLILSFTASCFAATGSDDGISPNYIGTDYATTTFKINTSGIATMRGGLSPKNSTVIDKVTMQFVIKNSSGTSVYNKTYTATWDSLYAQYIAEKTYQLSSKGTYTLQVTYRCYKNGALIETIRSATISKTY